MKRNLMFWLVLFVAAGAVGAGIGWLADRVWWWLEDRP